MPSITIHQHRCVWCKASFDCPTNEPGDNCPDVCLDCLDGFAQKVAILSDFLGNCPTFWAKCTFWAKPPQMLEHLNLPQLFLGCGFRFIGSHVAPALGNDAITA